MKKILLGIMLCLWSCESSVKQDIWVKKAHIERMEDLIQSIPNPLEVCEFISELEKSNRIRADYKEIFLPKAFDSRNYQSSYKKAVNLGVYRTDLYYANYHDSIQDVISYLDAISYLQSQLLSSTQPIDKRISSLQNTLKNKEMNLDSVLAVESNLFFEDIERHLQNLEKEEINAWIELGSWVESTYLATLYYDHATDQQLKERILEQKIILGRLMEILEIYKTKENFLSTYQNLTRLQKLYDQIDIKVSKEASQTHLVGTPDELIFEEVGGMQPIEVTDKQLSEICKLVSLLRAEIIR